MPRLILTSVWVRLRGFLRTAGGIIVITVVAVWALSSIPAPGAQGRLGGYRWRTASTARPRRPSRRSSNRPGSATGDDQRAHGGLRGEGGRDLLLGADVRDGRAGGRNYPGCPGDALRVSFDQSSGGHPIPAVLAFMVFLLAYTPCVATLAAQRAEIGLRWTVAGVAMQLAVAWLLAVAVFQVGRSFA